MRAGDDFKSCFRARTTRRSNYFHSVSLRRWRRTQLKTFGTISSAPEVTASWIYALFSALTKQKCVAAPLEAVFCCKSLMNTFRKRWNITQVMKEACKKDNDQKSLHKMHWCCCEYQVTKQVMWKNKNTNIVPHYSDIAFFKNCYCM